VGVKNLVCDGKCEWCMLALLIYPDSGLPLDGRRIGFLREICKDKFNVQITKAKSWKGYYETAGL
jgi:hypothetical protein